MKRGPYLSLRDVADRYRARQKAGSCGGGLKPLPIKRPTPVAAKPAVENDRRPRAASHEPCPFCSTRGDLGCDHFAPCAPDALPREGRGVLVEKQSLTGPHRQEDHA